MRRLKLWLVIVAAAALVTASAAIAWHKHGRTHTDTVATTLAATQSAIKNRTCTGEDGEYRKFHGKWTGSATGDRRLSGTLKVYASGLVHTATSNGQVTGSLRIRGERSGAKARFWAVYGAAGKLTGFVVGWAHDRAGSSMEDLAGSGRLLGTLTGSITNGTFNAQIGAGGTAAPVAAANIQGGGCGHRNKHRKSR